MALALANTSERRVVMDRCVGLPIIFVSVGCGMISVLSVVEVGIFVLLYGFCERLSGY